MKKSDTFADRRQDAEAAKIRRVEKFNARPDQGSPDSAARAIARQAQSASQVERKAAMDLEKRVRAESVKAESEAAAEANRLAENQETKRAADAAEAQSIIDEATRKAKRDARYANRKSKT